MAEARFKTLPGVTAALIVVGLGAGAARAQDISDVVRSVTVNNVDLLNQNVNADDHLYVVNLEDCRQLAADFDQDIEIIWNFTRSAPSGTRYAIKLNHDGQTCSTESTSDEATDECDVPVSNQTLSGSRLTYRPTWEDVTEDTSASGCENRRDVHDVTLVFEAFDRTTDGADDFDHDEVRFEFRTTRPSAPSGVQAQGGESTIQVDWDAVSDADSYDVFYSTSPLVAGSLPEDLVSSMENSTNETAELSDGITRDVTYYIAVSTIDGEGNASALSEVVTVTTQRVTDFYEYYRQQGGGDTGCATVGGSVPGAVWLGLVALFGPLAMARRRRRAASRAGAVLGALVVSLGVTGAARAEDLLQSPISGEFEIKLGDYQPEIDSEFAGAGPWETIFGPGGALYIEGEISYYLWREYGAVAIAVGLGYLGESGSGLNADGTLSVDDTSFRMVPLRLSVVYRFDVPPREWSVPLVPYVKLGFDTTIWWSKSAAGIATYRDPATDEIDEGRGVVFGWHVAAGLQFLLDVLAPAMSRTFDASTGVNNTYLFAEFVHADVDNFGSDSSIRLGDRAFLFGLAFEF